MGIQGQGSMNMGQGLSTNQDGDKGVGSVSYSLRGNIEQLSSKMNDIITEITYHRQ